MIAFSPEDNAALLDTAAALGANVQDLARLINFESNFNPYARNPFTGATGLVQFMPKTIASLGYKDSFDLLAQHPSIAKQLLGPVKKYLSQFKPFPSQQSVYMSVFFPAMRYADPQTTFRSWYVSTYGAQKGNALADTFEKQNPHIKKVQDYVDLVNGKKTPAALAAFFFSIAMLLLGGSYIYFKRKRGAYDRENDGGQLSGRCHRRRRASR